MQIMLLPNGYYRIFDRGSKLSGLYNADGTHRAGDLRLTAADALRLIATL